MKIFIIAVILMILSLINLSLEKETQSISLLQHIDHASKISSKFSFGVCVKCSDGVILSKAISKKDDNRKSTRILDDYQQDNRLSSFLLMVFKRITPSEHLTHTPNENFEDILEAWSICCNNNIDTGSFRGLDSIESQPLLLNEASLGVVIAGLPSDVRLITKVLKSFSLDFRLQNQAPVSCIYLSEQIASQLYDSLFSKKSIRPLAISMIFCTSKELIMINNSGGITRNLRWCTTDIEPHILNSDDMNFHEEMSKVMWENLSCDDGWAELHKIINDKRFTILENYGPFNHKFIRNSFKKSLS